MFGHGKPNSGSLLLGASSAQEKYRCFRALELTIQMPGNIQNALPLTVLPHSLSRAFGHVREYPVLDNTYRNGESQRSALAATSRKRWMLQKCLPPAALAELRDFYEARHGSVEPFYFYDPYETSPKFAWDPTGQSTQGRYTVRFNCDWNQSVGLVRSDVSIELFELA